MGRKGRFLFVSWDGGGNVPPALALAQKLVRRGHDVTFLASRSLEPATAAAGATFRGFNEMPEWGSNPGGRFEDDSYLGDLWFGPGVGKDVAAELERERIDALMIDFMVSSALAVAERSGLPTAALVHTLYHLHVEKGARYAEQWAQWLHPVNETRGSFNLAPIDSGGHPWDTADVVLATMPKEFDRPIKNSPANVHYVGPVFLDVTTGPANVQLPSNSSDPVVLVSMSTTYQRQEAVLQRVIEAMAELPVRGLVTTGPSIDAGAFMPPANVTVTSYIDHQTVLASVAAVVTHAGLSTVMAALAHGVPLLCLPMGRDQNANAERVVVCGAGQTLNPEASSAEIRAALKEVLGSPLIRSRAKRMQAIIRRGGNGSRAVDLLEGMLPREAAGLPRPRRGR